MIYYIVSVRSFVKHKCFLFLTIKDLLYFYCTLIFYTVHFEHFKHEKIVFKVFILDKWQLLFSTLTLNQMIHFIQLIIFKSILHFSLLSIKCSGCVSTEE